MSVLATFLQISDLHIGDIDPASGNATLSPAMVAMASNFQVFEGLLGHHAQGLADLAAFYKVIRPETGVFRLIVTGDLTRSGGVTEFQVARDFIHSQVDIKPPHGTNMVGLQLPADEVIAIPGNHDHWNGSTQPLGGRPSQYFNQGYSATPFIERIPLSNGRVVEFRGINSDSGVTPFSPSRMFALGKFQNELNQVQMPANANRDIRMLLIHHSWQASGTTLRMTKASKSALTKFLVANGFRGMLTGHMHLFSVPTVGVPNSQPFEEFRCGSSTQHDSVPYNWRNWGWNHPNRKFPQNTVLVHRVIGGPGVTTWETETFGRFSKGFKSLGAQHSFDFVV